MLEISHRLEEEPFCQVCCPVFSWALILLYLFLKMMYLGV
jgi:hypothetical protein